MQPLPQVRCVDCGFLAVRSKDAPELAEIDHEVRTNRAAVPTGYSNRPLCAVGRCEFKPTPTDPGGEYALWTGEASSARECDHFTKYLRGFSPKEHHEMYLSALHEQRAATQRAADKKEDFRQRLWLAVIPVAVGLVSGVVGFFARSWLEPKPPTMTMPTSIVLVTPATK